MKMKAQKTSYHYIAINAQWIASPTSQKNHQRSARKKKIRLISWIISKNTSKTIKISQKGINQNKN